MVTALSPRAKRALGIAAALLVATAIISPSVAVTNVGSMPTSGPPAIRLYDTTDPESPQLVGRTEDLPASGSYATVHDGLFVAVGSEVRLYSKGALDAPPRATWSGSGVLAIADGPERGTVLVLEGNQLTLVRFTDDASPAPVWSYAIDESALTGSTGRLLVRFGNHAYVADASIPGIRVLSIDGAAPPQTVAVYRSEDGMIHDLTLWGRILCLATESGLVVLDAGPAHEPAFTRLGSYVTRYRPAGVDANSRHAFVADGSDLLVLDIDPTSPDFLAAPVAEWAAPSAIRSVSLDKDGLAYVLVSDSCEVLDIAPYGGK